MFSILIVEDDKIILKGLARTFPWEEEGFSSVETASDGEQAVKYLQANQVDIVLTDINMPFMDGIQLAKYIRTTYPETIVILFTGYETFTYAKEALKLGVMDYLLKPVQQDELRDCLDRAKHAISGRRKEQDQIRKSLSFLRSETLSWLFRAHQEEKSVRERLVSVGLPCLDGACLAFIVCLEDYEQNDISGLDYTNMLFDMQQEVEKMLGSNGYVWVEGNSIIAGTNREENALNLNVSIRTWEHRWGVSLLATIGEAQENISLISRSYRQAREIQHQFEFVTHGMVIDYKEKDGIHTIGNDIPAMKRNLYRMLEEGRLDSCELLLRRLQDCFPLEEKDSFVLGILFDIGVITHSLEQQHILKSGVFTPNDYISQIVQSKSVSSQFSVVHEAIQRVCLSLDDIADADPLNKKMIAFIDEHSADSQLSLTVLGEYMEMSPAYLCSLFKKKNGVSFSEYVIALRMQRARVLLCTSPQKINEIALSVGITNPQYFCSRFKQMFGVTPSEYREKKHVAAEIS